MSSNFSLSEIGQIVYMIGSKFHIRINKCGNISIKPICGSIDNEFWVLSRVNGNYFWRRYADGNFGKISHPLNQVNRKRIGPIHKDVYNDKTYYWYIRDWDIRNCEIGTFDEAVNYFINYLKKYKNY